MKIFTYTLEFVTDMESNLTIPFSMKNNKQSRIFYNIVINQFEKIQSFK